MEFDGRAMQLDRALLQKLYFPDDGKLSDFSLGIEEEYFLVDAATNALAVEQPDELFTHSHMATAQRADREFLSCQIEVSTAPTGRVWEAGQDIRHFRKVVSTICETHGRGIVACGTHPTGRWEAAHQSVNPRYERVMNELGIIGRRNLVCGMHVHVQIPDPTRRIEIMTALIPFIPIFVALSSSSPFWRGEETGLRSYRFAAYDELPRTGIPELFESDADYRRYIVALEEAGAVPNSSYVWWAVRPSHRYPTLELRAPDCCTSVQDTVALAALYQSLVRHLFRGRKVLPDAVERALAVENKWQAQRYGTGARFAFLGGSRLVSEFLDEVVADVIDDAAALGCTDELLHCGEIVARGASADKQLRIYRNARHPEPFEEVLDWLRSETLSG